MDAFETKAKQWIADNTILLFVKGTKVQPMCGFSAQVIAIFSRIGKPFETINILEDEEVRANMKTFSNWPTFPQVYVNGEFIGGCDIVTEMYKSGELQPLVEKAFSEEA